MSWLPGRAVITIEHKLGLQGSGPTVAASQRPRHSRRHSGSGRWHHHSHRAYLRRGTGSLPVFRDSSLSAGKPEFGAWGPGPKPTSETSGRSHSSQWLLPARAAASQPELRRPAARRPARLQRPPTVAVTTSPSWKCNIGDVVTAWQVILRNIDEYWKWFEYWYTLNWKNTVLRARNIEQYWVSPMETIIE